MEIVEVETFDQVELAPSVGGVFVEVEVESQVVAYEVAREEWVEVSEVGPQGPPGAPGQNGGDSATMEWIQDTPSSSWVIPVPPALGRIPSVTVYVGGKLSLTDVTADATSVNIVFPSPTVGSAVLS